MEMSTNKCECLIKQFSNERYSRDRLKLVELSLQRQIIFERDGVPCPSIRQCGGHVIRLMDNEVAYMVMDFVQEKTEGPNVATGRCVNTYDTDDSLRCEWEKWYINLKKLFSQILWMLSNFPFKCALFLVESCGNINKYLFNVVQY